MILKRPTTGLWANRVLFLIALILVAGGWWGRWWAEPEPETAYFQHDATWVEVVEPGRGLVLKTEQVVKKQASGDFDAAAKMSQAGCMALGRKMNINLANEDELRFLPGIGPALASRIITYRRNHGPILSFEDLKKVKGIGDRLCARLEPWIRFEE